MLRANSLEIWVGYWFVLKEFSFLLCDVRKLSSAHIPCVPSSISVPFQLVSRCQWLRYIFQHEKESNYGFHYIDEEIEKFRSVCRHGQKQLSSCDISEFSVYLVSIGNIFLEVISSSYIVLSFGAPIDLSFILCLLDKVLKWHFLFHLLFSSFSQSQWSPLLEELYGISWYAAASGLSIFSFCVIKVLSLSWHRNHSVHLYF